MPGVYTCWLWVGFTLYSVQVQCLFCMELYWSTTAEWPHVKCPSSTRPVNYLSSYGGGGGEDGRVLIAHL